MKVNDILNEGGQGSVALNKGKWYVVAKFDNGKVEIVGNTRGYNTPEASEEVQDAGRAESHAELNKYFSKAGFEDFYSYKTEELIKDFPQNFHLK